MDKPNRDQRRRNKFGGGRASEHGGWPTVRPNPVFAGDDASAEAGAEPAAKLPPMPSCRSRPTRR